MPLNYNALDLSSIRQEDGSVNYQSRPSLADDPSDPPAIHHGLTADASADKIRVQHFDEGAGDRGTYTLDNIESNQVDRRHYAHRPGGHWGGRLQDGLLPRLDSISSIE